MHSIAPGRAIPSTCPRRCARRRASPRSVAPSRAHFPTSFDARDAALDRLAFDRLLALQLGMVGRRRRRGRDSARPVEVGDAIDTELRGALEGSARPEARPDRLADAGRGCGDRDIRRYHPPDADAPPAPGRCRLRQDGGRGVRARGRGAGRAAGRAPRAHGPPRAPASPDPDVAARGRQPPVRL